MIRQFWVVVLGAVVALGVNLITLWLPADFGATIDVRVRIGGTAAIMVAALIGQAWLMRQEGASEKGAPVVNVKNVRAGGNVSVTATQQNARQYTFNNSAELLLLMAFVVAIAGLVFWQTRKGSSPQYLFVAGQVTDIKTGKAAGGVEIGLAVDGRRFTTFTDQDGLFGFPTTLDEKGSWGTLLHNTAKYAMQYVTMDISPTAAFEEVRKRAYALLVIQPRPQNQPPPPPSVSFRWTDMRPMSDNECTFINGTLVRGFLRYPDGTKFNPGRSGVALRTWISGDNGGPFAYPGMYRDLILDATGTWQVDFPRRNTDFEWHIYLSLLLSDDPVSSDLWGVASAADRCGDPGTRNVFSVDWIVPRP